MNTASLENCKKLYELSGWEDDDLDYSWIDYMVQGEVEWVLSHFNDIERRPHKTIPAYDLGYLLRRLPKVQASTGSIYKHLLTLEYSYPIWNAGYPVNNDFTVFSFGVADTPEDAACLLLILLIEQGIIDPNEHLPSNRTKTGAN